MNPRKEYTGIKKRWGILSHGKSFFLLLLLAFFFSDVAAQYDFDYEEISLIYEIKGIGVFEMPAVIRDNTVFLPVTDLFNTMKIKAQISGDMDIVSGFFIDENKEYSINHQENKVSFSDKTYQLTKGDLIRTETNLYMQSEYFGKIFDLDCYFNFRNLKVTVTSKVELPAIREMKLAELRKTLGKLRGEVIADTTIKRTYPVFRFGMADWSVYSSQESDGNTDLRLNVGLGAMLAGGELKTSLYYYSNTPFSEKQQQYLWRYVDNDFKVVRQVMAGKIAANATSTLYNPVVGVQVTNTPTTYRRSFGSYTLSDKTEPGWTVELYVNNTLVDYVKADASGFFKFEIPLVYGNSSIKLKFYGPWGEEQVREQFINIPYNFLPEKSFEYKISAGVVEDTSLSRFSRVDMNYGISRNITIGGGAEYFSSLSSQPFMPFLKASFNVFNNVLLSGEYVHGIKTTGIFSYRMPSNANLSVEYIKYTPDQKAIRYNYLEEGTASLTFPVRIKNFSAYNRFSVKQIKIPTTRFSNGEAYSSFTNYTSGDWTISASFPGVSTSVSTTALRISDSKANVNSSLSMSVKLPANFVVIPQAQYGYNRKEFYSAKLAIEKRVKDKAFLNLSVEKSFISNQIQGELGVRYNFSFAQVGASVRQVNKVTSLIEYARGSLINDVKKGYIGTSNQSNVGKGGIYFIPFLDINGNGVRDNDEPKIAGLDARAGSGRVEKDPRDSTIRILGLEPYTKCYVELDESSFENISWRLPVKVLAIAVDPEIIKHVEIPITVVGEASGMVVLNRNNIESGLGRITVRFFSKDGKVVASTLSEDDGYFSWFGLTPGEYSAMVDTSQLKRLGMISEPATRPFTVTPGRDGDIIDGLDFRLQPSVITSQPEIKQDTLVAVVKKPETVIRKDTSVMVVHEVFEELVTITKDSWAIQLGAFKNRANAENLRKMLESQLGRKVEIVIADDFFKVRINEIPDRPEVDRIIEVLKNNGITELWIIGLKAKQQHIVLRERQDSVIKIVETKVEEPEMFESKIFMPMNEVFYKLDRPTGVMIDQTVINIMKSHSELGKMKFKEITPNVRIIRSDTTEIEVPGDIIVEVDVQPEPVEEIIVQPEPVEEIIDPVVFTYTTPELVSKEVNTLSRRSAPKTVVVPKISLQVGVYYKKAEAVRVQKKVKSKLNVPVKIVEQWEYYRVIITGFTSREETYQYYPELAGMGLPAPLMLED
ncbi:MAG TPA: SPOR domain-containing protein [Bacteroidales bacterium]|nr:SPOR domain-containing protein [Bacteroidales bacterium]